MHLKTHIILPSYPYRDHNAKYQHGSGLDAIIKPSSSYTDFIPTTRTVKTAIIKIIIVILLFFFFKSMFTTRIKIIERQVNLKSKLHHNFDNEDKNFINLNTMRLQFQNANRIRLRRLKETCQKMDLLVKLTAESASADSQVNELLNYQMMPKFTSKINQARFKTSWKIGSVAEDQQDPKLHFQHRGLNQPEENDNFLINDWAMCIPPKQGTTSWQRLLIAASQNKQVKEVHWNYGLYHILESLGSFMKRNYEEQKNLKKNLTNIIQGINQRDKKILVIRHPVEKLYSVWFEKFRLRPNSTLSTLAKKKHTSVYNSFYYIAFESVKNL